MGYAKISANAFNSMGFNAGLLLNAIPQTMSPIPDENIICATTGGVTANCTPTYLDLGEDVDNCPKNTKELKRLDGWDCSLSFTALNMTPELIKLALGAAESNISSDGNGSVSPRSEVKSEDFTSVWLLLDRLDGGYALVSLSNALGNGLSLTTTDKGKGQVGVELTGHVSINSQATVPMSFSIYPSSTSTGA